MDDKIEKERNTGVQDKRVQLFKDHLSLSVEILPDYHKQQNPGWFTERLQHEVIMLALKVNGAYSHEYVFVNVALE